MKHKEENAENSIKICNSETTTRAKEKSNGKGIIKGKHTLHMHGSREAEKKS